METTESKLPGFEEYLDRNPNVGKILYYPGGFEDISPIELFIRKSTIQKFIYVDYLYSSERIPHFNSDTIYKLFANWEEPIISELFPHDFGKRNWEAFWFPNPDSTNFATWEKSYGYKHETRNYDREADFFIDFYYLATEAIQTYKILIENNLIPNVLVLQDHGFGCFWNYFGMPNGNGNVSFMYEIAQNNLPEYIFSNGEDIRGNTKIWPGYVRVTEPVECVHAMHKPDFKALYKKQ